MKYSKTDTETALSGLRDLLKPGMTVHTVLRSVSRSGMTRVITPFVMTPEGPQNITHWAAVLLGEPVRNGGIVQTGCGMDMGFNLVYNLSYHLFPKGFKLADNQIGRNGDKTGYDNDGGYALKQSWM